MKTTTLLAVLLLAAFPAFAQSSFTREAQTLWEQREKARADAVKAVDDKYRDALEGVYWRAVQAKDPAAAVLKVELDKFGALKQSGVVAKPVLPKAMVGKWEASYPGGAKGTWEFKDDGTVTVTMGTSAIPQSAGTWTKTKDSVDATFSGAVTKFAWPIKGGKISGNDANGRSVALTEARK